MFSTHYLLLGMCSLVFASPISNSSLKHSMIRIVGGKDAKIEDYPYQVSILADGQHLCGGSILTNTFILCAAHCFAEESRVSHITIRAGSSLRTSGGQILGVRKINSHDNFNPDNYDYDVAVVELTSPLTFGTGIQPIALPTSSTPPINNGQSSTVTGWGLTTDFGELATVLQVVTVPLITTSTCQTNYYGSAVTSRMVCAGEAGKDSCSGDSGGPLVSNGVQVGIVSWGDICGEASTPGVYTLVSEFLPYINGIIGPNKSKH